MWHLVRNILSQKFPTEEWREWRHENPLVSEIVNLGRPERGLCYQKAEPAGYCIPSVEGPLSWELFRVVDRMWNIIRGGDSGKVTGVLMQICWRISESRLTHSTIYRKWGHTTVFLSPHGCGNPLHRSTLAVTREEGHDAFSQPRLYHPDWYLFSCTSAFP